MSAGYPDINRKVEAGMQTLVPADRDPPPYQRLIAEVLFRGRVHRWALKTLRTSLSQNKVQGKQMILVISVPTEIAVLFNSFCAFANEHRRRRGKEELTKYYIATDLLLVGLKQQAIEVLGEAKTKITSEISAELTLQWVEAVLRVKLRENEQQEQQSKLEVPLPNEIEELFNRFCTLTNGYRRRQDKEEFTDNHIATHLFLEAFNWRAKPLVTLIRK